MIKYNKSYLKEEETAIKCAVNKDAIQWFITRYLADYENLEIKQEWLNDQQPTICQLEAIRNKTKKPLAFFFMKPHPNSMPHEIKWDHRAVGSAKIALNYKIDVQIQEMLHRREQCIELSQSLGLSILPSFQTFDISDNKEDIIRYIRDRIVPPKGINSAREYLRKLIRRLEDLNIMLFKIDGRLEKNLRGMAIYFDNLPIIGITSFGESLVGQIFSIYHELAHILTKSSMIHKNYEYDHTYIESYCNDVAAKVLLPDEWFKLELPLIELSQKKDITLEDIKKTCYIYHVSRDAFLIRIKTLKIINKLQYGLLVQELENVRKNEPPPVLNSAAAKSMHNSNTVNAISRKLCGLVMKGVNSKVIEPYKLYDYTGKSMNKSFEIIKHYDNGNR